MPNSTLAEVRSEMERMIKEFIRGNNRGKVFNLRVQAGAGKNHAATKVINASFPHDSHVAWFASMHDQFNDFGNLRKKWIHIRGRTTGSAEKSHVSGFVPENCPYADEARKLGSMGYSVSTVLCKERCRDVGECKYWKQLSRRGHKFMPHQMLFFFNGENVPLVVFDELNINIFLEKYTLDGNRLVSHARMENREFWQALIRLISEREEISGSNLYTKLDSVFSGSGSLRERLASLQFVESTTPDLENDEEMPIFGIGQKLRDIMLSEMDSLSANTGFNPRIVVNPKCNRINKAQIEIWTRREPPEWLTDKPIILLGAKGAPELFQKVLKRSANDFIDYAPAIDIPDAVEIVQEQESLLPEATLKNKRNRELVYGEVSQHLDGNLSKTCLICHNDYEQDFAELLGLKLTKHSKNGATKYADTGHYWGIRGLNAWKDYQQIVLIGTPTPNIDDMLRQVQALYWDENPLDKTESSINSSVRSYTDPRINQYLQSLREDELYQAIFRIRPLELNGRAKIKIIIATSLPVKDIDSISQKIMHVQTARDKKKQDKRGILVGAALWLLNQQGSFTRKELAREANSSTQFVGFYSYHISDKDIERNIKWLVSELNLHEYGKYPKKYSYQANIFQYSANISDS